LIIELFTTDNWEEREKMFDGIINTFTSINWEVIFQLLSVALIVIAGPAVIFVLAFRNGNL
jgi:Photosystem II complex subunit Ycf12